MRCAYCNEDKKATKEHIIPNGFLKLMNLDEQIRWTETAPCRVIGSDFLVKDVCSECNNGVLSELDNYALNLITKYNGKIDKNTKKIFFKYDYSSLSRWLLKVCYNSARANKLEYDISSYENCIPYIKDDIEIKNQISIFALFMDLNINGKVHDFYHFQSDLKYKIDFFRIAPFKLTDRSTYKCSMRSILINSFAFLIIVYDEDIKNDEISEIEKIVKESFNIEKLESCKKIKLIKDKTFFEKSLYTNMMLHDSYLTKREVKNDNYKLYLIEITKEEVLQENYNKIYYFIISKRDNKENVKAYYQKFVISISGYDDDKRELWCIPEFQRYVTKIIERFPEIIWYLKFETGFFEAMLLAYINKNYTVNTDNKINVSQEKVVEFMNRCYIGINKLLNQFVLDNSYNDKITKLFNKNLFNILNIPH